MHDGARALARRGHVRRWLIAVALVAAGAVFAHQWDELLPASFEFQELEAALVATEAVQAVIDVDTAPPLAADAWAFEWWRWFGAAAVLDDRVGLDALGAALADAGFPHAGQAAVPAWREVMEHLVTAADAHRLSGVDLDELEAAFAGTVPFEDPVRLSYLASLAGQPAPAAGVAPFVVRFEALVAAARAVAP